MRPFAQILLVAAALAACLGAARAGHELEGCIDYPDAPGCPGAPPAPPPERTDDYVAAWNSVKYAVQVCSPCTDISVPIKKKVRGMRLHSTPPPLLVTMPPAPASHLSRPPPPPPQCYGGARLTPSGGQSFEEVTSMILGET